MNQKLSQLPDIFPDQIEKRVDRNVLFVRKVGDYSRSGPEAWKEMHAFIKTSGLEKSALRYFGISHDDPHITEEEKLRYDACIFTPNHVPASEGVGQQILKGGKYAIFTHNGSYERIDETFDRIFFKWLPESKKKIDDRRPCFSEYFHIEWIEKDPSQLVTKIYIPLC